MIYECPAERKARMKKSIAYSILIIIFSAICFTACSDLSKETFRSGINEMQISTFTDCDVRMEAEWELGEDCWLISYIIKDNDLVPRYLVWNGSDQSCKNIPIGTEVYHVDKIISSKHITFQATGIDAERDGRNFPRNVHCILGTDGEWQMREQLLYVPLTEVIEAGSVRHEILQDINVSKNEIHFIFAKDMEEESDFYLDYVDIPKVLIGYEKNNNALTITFDKEVVIDKELSERLGSGTFTGGIIERWKVLPEESDRWSLLIFLKDIPEGYAARKDIRHDGERPPETVAFTVFVM